MYFKGVHLILALLPLGIVAICQPRDEPERLPSSFASQQQIRVARVPRDEFNSTDGSNPFDMSLNEDSNSAKSRSSHHSHLISALRQILVKFKPEECCPSWQNLTGLVSSELALEEQTHRRKHSKSSAKDSGATMLTTADLMQELKRTSLNITYLSIDGQQGDSERDKYYNFYDTVLYYQKLLKLANQTFSDELARGSSIDGGNKTFADTQDRMNFKRSLNSVEFRTSKDPFLSSFLDELREETSKGNSSNRFDLYEDFILETNFGKHYAQNISLIRESVSVFDQVYSHLMQLDFQSNLTRPSRLYEMIRRMSFELYLIKAELLESTSIRVRSNREDVRRTLGRLDVLAEIRPYVRMLGDEFSLQPPYFSEHVRQLTHLLDLYLTNSLTQMTFYDQLSELPESFIMLGASIAHEYETKEVPQYTRFDSSHFGSSGIFGNLNSGRTTTRDQEKRNSSQIQERADGRQSNLSFMTRLFN